MVDRVILTSSWIILRAPKVVFHQSAHRGQWIVLKLEELWSKAGWNVFPWRRPFASNQILGPSTPCTSLTKSHRANSGTRSAIYPRSGRSPIAKSSKILKKTKQIFASNWKQSNKECIFIEWCIAASAHERNQQFSASFSNQISFLVYSWFLFIHHIKLIRLHFYKYIFVFFVVFFL